MLGVRALLAWLTLTIIPAIQSSEVLLWDGSVVEFSSPLFVSSPLPHDSQHRSVNCSIIVSPLWLTDGYFSSYADFCSDETFPHQFDILHNTETLSQVIQQVKGSLLQNNLTSVIPNNFRSCMKRFERVLNETETRRSISTHYWNQEFVFTLALDGFSSCYPEKIGEAASKRGFKFLTLESDYYVAPGWVALTDWASTSETSIPMFDVTEMFVSGGAMFVNLSPSKNPYHWTVFNLTSFFATLILTLYKIFIVAMCFAENIHRSGKGRAVILLIAIFEGLPCLIYLPLAVIGIFQELSASYILSFPFVVSARTISRECFFLSNFVLAMFIRRTLASLDQKTQNSVRVVVDWIVVLIFSSIRVLQNVDVILNTISYQSNPTYEQFSVASAILDSVFDILVALYILIQRSRLVVFMSRVGGQIIRSENLTLSRNLRQPIERKTRMLILSSALIVVTQILYSSIRILSGLQETVPVWLVVSISPVIYWLMTLTGIFQLHCLVQRQIINTRSNHNHHGVMTQQLRRSLVPTEQSPENGEPRNSDL